MGYHMESREAATAHLYFSGFIPHTTKKGWWRKRDKADKVRALIQTIEGAEVVMIRLWCVG